MRSDYLITKRAERFKRQPCVHCGHGIDGLVLCRVITQSGTEQYRWTCSNCGKFATRTVDNIPHDVISLWMRAGFIPQHDDIPIWNDYTGERCAVCGAIGVELHHWAPESLAAHFGDEWHRWPTVYLCLKHHREWHEIVTWYLHGYQQRRAEFEQAYYQAAGI